MSSPKFFENNKHRLDALRSYNILDTIEEKDYDELTSLAATICGVPFALISLIDENRQWFKSHIGTTITETPLELSFCVKAIVKDNDITVIEDTHTDHRVKDNPLVTGDPFISFYAGVPLINEDGYGLGTLCILDPKPKSLSDEQKAALKIIARQVMDKLELKRKMIELEKQNKLLQQSEKKIKELHKDQSISRKAEKQFNTELANINEELKLLNDKQASTNKELLLKNNELESLQKTLKKALTGISESEERFRTMAQGTNILIAVADESSNAIYFNKAWTDVTGRSMQDLLAFGWVDLIHNDDKERFLNIYLNAFKDRVPFTGEFRLLNKNSTYEWFLATGPPRFNADGTFAGYISSCINITEKKKDEQRKNDFISIVSHELKTPLTSLKANIQILQINTNNNYDKFLQEGLERADRQINKMNALINGFLNVARLESGKIHIDRQRFDMAHLMAEIEAEIKATINSHTIIFAPLEETFVNADKDKIGQVINNFISNAVKYSPSGSAINIACITINKLATVSVKDCGIGIQPEDAAKIFERFYRVDSNQTKTISGFGIGLYLSAEIIHRHQGQVWVESEPGKGSVFYFNIPTID